MVDWYVGQFVNGPYLECTAQVGAVCAGAVYIKYETL